MCVCEVGRKNTTERDGKEGKGKMEKKRDDRRKGEAERESERAG